MTDADLLARQIELLHKYHLDLWTEIEAQLRVLQSAQEEIAKLRSARPSMTDRQLAAESAQMLARHVQAMKGRVGALGTTVAELDETVGELLHLLT